MKLCKFLRDHVFPFWRTLVVVLTPIVAAPLPIVAAGTKMSLTGYTVIVMAVFWVTDAVPVAVASLIPVAVLPVFGIMSTDAVSRSYMSATSMMFVGGLMVALAVEYCDLHRRLALRVLLAVGTSPRMIMLGFMSITCLLSMWISNTAATAMMVPIAQAVLDELLHEDREDTAAPISGKKKKIRVGVMMSLAYASNIGGTGTLVGSGTQLVLKGILQSYYGSAPGLNFATWMAFNVPGMLFNLAMAWLWLQLLFVGPRCRGGDRESGERVKKLLRRKYDELGAITFHQVAISILFVICVLLWFFRDPQFMPGWAQLFPDADVDDATSVMVIVIIMFVVPAEPNFWCLRTAGAKGKEKPSRSLLDWRYVQQRLPWGIVLLLGAGFALSDACKVSGLSQWLGEQLSVLKAIPPFATMLIVCLMAAAVTEVASNAATASIMLPILADLAVQIQVNPLLLMLPATVTCSYAFMLPVSTPPNAIVYSASPMKPVHMMRAGIVMNVACIVVICLMTQTLGVYMFDLYTFPQWAWPNTTTATPTTISHPSQTGP